jgi:hypothetical protein
MEQSKKVAGLRIGTYAEGELFPAPTEIDCIQVTRVYNEGIHKQVREVQLEFDVEGLGEPLIAHCGDVKVLEQSCTVLKEGLVKVKAVLEVSCFLNGTEESEIFTVEKVLRLARAGETGLQVYCQVFPECLSCFVSGEEEDEEELVIVVTACVGILILVKVVALVQLLVPTFGFCPEPPVCDEVLAECPDFDPPWPPYPPEE